MRQVRPTQVQITPDRRLLGRHPGWVVATESAALDMTFVFNRGLRSHPSSLGYKCKILQIHRKRK